MVRNFITPSEELLPGPAVSGAGSFQRHPYVEQDNAVSLQIYRALQLTVKECEPHAAPYLNLVEVFFHDLMFILTAYSLQLHELNGPYRPEDAAEWSPQRGMPYIGFADVERGVDPDAKTYGFAAADVTRNRRLVSALSAVAGASLWGRGTVAIAKPSSLNARHLVSALLQARMSVAFPSPIPLTIPNLDDQVRQLSISVGEISNRLGWPSSSAPLMELIRRHIHALAREGDPEPVSYQVLVCGSLAEPFNRLLAARARAAGVPVVAVSHGGGEGMYDEPLFGYSERSYATSLLGFGPAGGELLGTAEYVESLHEPPVYVESDEPYVKSLYRNPGIPPLTTLEGKKVFYVPTSFSGPMRYGPFRDMPDGMYLQWQERLFLEFPDAVWKGYPNDFSNRKPVPTGAKHISRVPFQDCLHEADVFIFDYLSTAFCLAAATDKPIIYFDIGLRNPSKIAWNGIADRCTYIPVDLAHVANLKEQVMARAQDPRSNTFTSRISLATTPCTQSRTQIAVNLAKGTLR